MRELGLFRVDDVAVVFYDSFCIARWYTKTCTTYTRDHKILECPLLSQEGSGRFAPRVCEQFQRRAI